MRARYALLLALAVAVTLTSVAAAGPSAAKQRVAITNRDLPDGKFLLTPLQDGALTRDAGTSHVDFTDPQVVMREGQRVEIYRTTFTLKGKRGSLTIRERIEWVYAGNPYVGTGTWKVVRGTGAYAGIAGGGRTASAGLNHGNGAWYVHQEGFLTRS
jgi:hypothetical protein